MGQITDYGKGKKKLTLHGDGFIQIPMPGDQRIHVWHPDLPYCSCLVYGSIHDHRFAFTSRVLIGTQKNTVYAVSREVFPTRTTYISYGHEGERNPCGSRPWTPKDEFQLDVVSVEVVQAGVEYSMEPYIFHKSVPDVQGAVGATLMKKGQIHDRPATSLRQKGVPPDEHFDRNQVSQKDMWAIVADVLANS